MHKESKISLVITGVLLLPIVVMVIIGLTSQQGCGHNDYSYKGYEMIGKNHNVVGYVYECNTCGEIEIFTQKK